MKTYELHTNVMISENITSDHRSKPVSCQPPEFTFYTSILTVQRKRK